MKWFTAALYDSETRIRPGREADSVVRGPFEDDGERDQAMKDYRREVKAEGYTPIMVRFDVSGDEEFVEVVNEESVV
jgi:hypothetical protein